MLAKRGITDEINKLMSKKKKKKEKLSEAGGGK